MGNLVFFGFAIIVTAGIFGCLLVTSGQPLSALVVFLGSLMFGCAFIFSDNQPNQSSNFGDVVSKLKVWWS